MAQPAYDPEDEGDPGLDPVVRRAKMRFKRCADWESTTRQANIDDIKFAEADAYNGYQWPDAIRNRRQIDQRPTLTINKVRNHNLLIINDAKKNKPGVKVRPTGNGATKESADVLEGIIRHIEYISRAQVAYDISTEFQVKIGIGYCRIVTDYIDDESFDQELIVLPVNDPLTVYLDPDIQQRDGSDAKFGFIFQDMPKEQFKEKYPEPEWQESVGQNVLGEDTWIDKDHVRIAEYYEREDFKDTVVSWIDAQSKQRLTILKSKIPSNVFAELDKDPATRTRPVVRSKVTWYKIIGDKIADKTSWLGKYIPIARVIGEESCIDGKYDRKGHTRAMIDPQRIYNYMSSTAVEGLFLQTKAPWYGPTAAIEELENYWNTANTENHAYLPFNHLDEDGQPIPAPQRIQPADMMPGYLKGMEVAGQELMAVSGQFQAQTGEPSNERSGKAIQERQHQGDTATYHFTDNLGVMIAHIGRMLVDLIPKIYDTERIIKILAEDNTDQEVLIDPQAKQAFQQKLDQNNRVVQRIFNPNVGRYEVQADIGPAYASKREEAFNAFTQIITQAPALTAVVGDILLRAGDFPGAEEAAERLKRMVPPQALGQGPSANEQKLTGQVTQLQALVSKLLEEVGIERLKLKGKDEMRDIDVYDATTKRISALQDFIPMDPEGLKQLVAGLVHEAMNTNLEPVLASNAKDLAQASGEAQPQLPGMEPPLPGAQKAPNGEWILRDPTRVGRFLRVGPLAVDRDKVT